MSGGIYAAASGAMAQQLRIEMVANNLSNMNTVGWKADIPGFRVSEKNPGRNRPAGETGYPNHPVMIPMEVRSDFSQGPVKDTGNPLDFAITGEGFFQVRTKTGTAYTRKGDFSLNGNGTLVTRDGYPVLGSRGEILLEDADFIVDTEGNIHVDGDSVDYFRISAFRNPETLTHIGNGLFVPSGRGAGRIDAEDYSIQQGSLEFSNVNPISAMTSMIEAHRMFESYQTIIRTLDESTGRLIDEAGRYA